MQKFIFSIAFIILCFSCTKDIEIDQPDYSSKVVVDGWIANNDYANVILTKSSPFLTDYDSASIRNTFLNYAKVTVTSSKGETEVLTLFRKDEFFPPFVYKTVSLKGEVGVEYDLKIEVGDDVITSTTLIPKLPEIEGVYVNVISDTTMNFRTLINDDESTLNYYYTEINIKNVNRNYHASAFPLFNDLNNNGALIEKYIYRSVEPDPLNLNDQDDNRNLPTYEFYRTDTVNVRISTIDEVSYGVLYDIYIDQVNSSNPFSFINKNTSTNINGGIGRWTGMASREFVLTNK